ncbi:MAG: hypothetical protein JWL81_1900 [Verrucomicrobiales bacterium]|nr:hypothetical protein [Verrucomicrobiales bacterium]
MPPADPDAFDSDPPPPSPHSWLSAYWEKLGGGSLTISLILHAALIILALVWFVSSRLSAPPETVDFLPGGGGGQGGAEKSQEKQRQRAVRQSTPAMRIVSSALSPDAIALPDVSSTLLPSPTSVSTAMTGGALGAGSGTGSGGGRGSGTGTGVGSGFGPGSGGGFISVPSIFGSAGTGGLTGTLYDMKQTRDGKSREYNGGVEEFFPRLYEIAEKRFRKDAFNDFYRAKVTLSYTMLAVPNVPAEEGPRAFQADKEIQPRGWFLHYHGTIDPPTEGDWRFAGIFDDALLVYVNNRLVFDGSYDSQADPSVRSPFGSAVFAGSGNRPFVGKWVKLKRGSTLDILVGERPGGRVGGLLLVQDKSKKYQEREKDIPLLPVLAFNPPRKEDKERMEKLGIPIAAETPVFKIDTQRSPLTLGSGRSSPD